MASSALAGSVYDKLAGLDTEGGRLAQGFRKAPSIRVVLENRLPPVPAVENMINRPAYSTRALRAIHRLSHSLSAPAKSEFQEAPPSSTGGLNCFANAISGAAAEKVEIQERRASGRSLHPDFLAYLVGAPAACQAFSFPIARLSEPRIRPIRPVASAGRLKHSIRMSSR